MEIVLVMLLMCGKPDTIFIIQEDYQVYIDANHISPYQVSMLRDLIGKEGVIKVQYEDPNQVCI